VNFWIPCNPPKGTYQSGRTILRTASGRPFIGKTKGGKALRDTLFSLLYPHAPAQPLQGPVRLCIKYAYPFRKTEKKGNVARGWLWCDTRPDADNLAKQIQDTMGLLRYFGDDGQIAVLQVEKIWSLNPGIGITLEELND
jgi:Holliday junction resolvase RusA-like endonuclease